MFEAGEAVVELPDHRPDRRDYLFASRALIPLHRVTSKVGSLSTSNLLPSNWRSGIAQDTSLIVYCRATLFIHSVPEKRAKNDSQKPGTGVGRRQLIFNEEE